MDIQCVMHVDLNHKFPGQRDVEAGWPIVIDSTSVDLELRAPPCVTAANQRSPNLKMIGTKRKEPCNPSSQSKASFLPLFAYVISQVSETMPGEAVRPSVKVEAAITASQQLSLCPGTAQT